MFCPNCGTQNDDSAAACQKCAFNLKGATAPKFKGTMLMVNAPPTAPRPVAGPSAVSARPPAAQPAPAPTPAAAAPRPMGAGAKPMMKATMIGVAPPSPGAPVPPAPAAPRTAPQPEPSVTAPTSPAFAMPQGGTVTLQAAPEPVAIATSQAQHPGHLQGRQDVVNPLGGTMVATPGAMGFGAAAPQAFPGPSAAVPAAPVPVPTTHEVPAAPTFGATTPTGFAPNELAGTPPPQQPAAGGWGGPVAGMPPPQQPYGIQQPPAQQAGYAAYGAPPAAIVPAPQAMQPMGQHGGYAMPTGPGHHGPIGKMRNPVMVVVLTYVTCGIYGLVAFLTMLGELKSFRQKNDISPILFFLPVIGILETIKLPAKVLDAKRMAGVPNAKEPNVILYLFLGLYMLPADLNEIWQVSSAKQGYGALPPAGM